MFTRKAGFDAGRMIFFGLGFSVLHGVTLWSQGREEELADNVGIDLLGQVAGWLTMNAIIGKFEDHTPGSKTKPKAKAGKRKNPASLPPPQW
jgi:hypothetical protein